MRTEWASRFVQQKEVELEKAKATVQKELSLVKIRAQSKAPLQSAAIADELDKAMQAASKTGIDIEGMRRRVTILLVSLDEICWRWPQTTA
jgi:capsular polysaccharide biosynthesis protein